MVSEAVHCFSITLVFRMLPMSRDLFGLPLPAAKINGIIESIYYQYIAVQGCSCTYLLEYNRPDDHNGTTFA